MKIGVIANLKILSVLMVIAVVGCASYSGSTLNSEGSKSTVIYALSQEEAFAIAQRVADAAHLPGERVDEMNGEFRGYTLTYLSWDAVDTYSCDLAIIPATGITDDGRKVNGFYFEISGTGTAFVYGKIKNDQLFQDLKKALHATGTAKAIKSMSIGEYEDSTTSNSAEDAANSLREIKKLYDEKVIDQHEYEIKKAEILRRM
ncbi:MAG: SHOCT domain-containing protein [Syntrophobacteraceae bacterium]